MSNRLGHLEHSRAFAQYVFGHIILAYLCETKNPEHAKDIFYQLLRIVIFES